MSDVRDQSIEQAHQDTRGIEPEHVPLFTAGMGKTLHGAKNKNRGGKPPDPMERDRHIGDEFARMVDHHENERDQLQCRG